METLSCSIGWNLSKRSIQFNFMQVWTDLGYRKWPYAPENNFMQVWTDLCNRKCSYVAENNFMRMWTNLSLRKGSCRMSLQRATYRSASLLYTV